MTEDLETIIESEKPCSWSLLDWTPLVGLGSALYRERNNRMSLCDDNFLPTISYQTSLVLYHGTIALYTVVELSKCFQ